MALKANIVLPFCLVDPSRPIGDVPLLFSKQGARLRALQQEITLREMDKSLVSLHTVLANGGDAGLANLETAQKIVASPTLLAQLKKDTELSKKALVSAVAWLKDIRSVKDAQAAAAKVCFCFCNMTLSQTRRRPIET